MATLQSRAFSSDVSAQSKKRLKRTGPPSSIPVYYSNSDDDNIDSSDLAIPGKLETLKQRENELRKLLAEVRREKLDTIRMRPLTIGVIGFGRFGQFIARTFSKYGRVVVTSRSDYTDIAQGMGAKYTPLSDLDTFLSEDLDVIVVATSILSFKSSIQKLVPALQKDIDSRLAKSDGQSVRGPLIVDVLSVKEHARNTMLELLPKECDILCTHPMFGPDSGKDSWRKLNFVYEKVRVNKVVFDYKSTEENSEKKLADMTEENDSHIEGVDRVERFLSIWEEEGCNMVQMGCKEHDEFAANSQFLTHLMGRILGSQGLSKTPIDTKGFESVLQLIESTTADSFELFFGLFKYNTNSMDTMMNLRSAMDDVIQKLQDEDSRQKELSDKKS